jgi:hypothetical protein
VYPVRPTRQGERDPLPRLWVAYLRQTGQRERLPYWAPMVCEADDAEVLARFRERGAPP